MLSIVVCFHLQGFMALRLHMMLDTFESIRLVPAINGYLDNYSCALIVWFVFGVCACI